MADIGVEIGDLLRPHRAGMARYAASLVLALQAQRRDIDGWARWRRLPGWFLKPRSLRVRFFGASHPSNAPRLFHATACVFPSWKSPVEIATLHDLFAIQDHANLSADEIRRRTAYVHRADRIICVSQFTRTQAHALLGIPESRTVAIPLTAASHFVPASADDKQRLRRKLQLPNEFFLFVGRDRPTKNLDRLVRAYAISGLTMPLCIAGSQSKHARQRLSQLTREHRSTGSLLWLGEIAERDLPVLFSCASALCMPSIFEGFGLPVIEAMACGTAVLTSAGCATEEAAGGHATLVDPQSVESIADGLQRVLTTTDAQRAAARTYATRRSWDDVATETWRVYQG